MSPAVRSRVDACPGVFAPHDAADGALARVRLPGGVISAAALRAIADCADELGDGSVHLTSRGNLQLRGLTRGPALAERLAAAGLLPSATHERVRNVLASPLSGIAAVGPVTAAAGIDTRGPGVRGLAAALDRGLCARPDLAGLPGRFLFALDDGRGDVAAEDPDLCWQAVAPSAGVLRAAGVVVGAVPVGDAVRVLLDAAEVFLALRGADGGTAWRVAEVPGAAGRIAAGLGLAAYAEGVGGDGAGAGGPLAGGAGAGAGASRVALLAPSASGGTLLASAERATAAGPGPASTERTTAAVPGPIRRDDGGDALVVAPLLGELTAEQVRLLAAAVSDREPTTAGFDREPTAVVTPWRTIVLPDPRLPAKLAAAELAAAGLVVAPGPAADLSACAGHPGCGKALADVRGDARRALGTLPAGRVHVSGCARRCGAPRTPHVDAVALADGRYEIDGIARPGLVP